MLINKDEIRLDAEDETWSLKALGQKVYGQKSLLELGRSIRELKRVIGAIHPGDTVHYMTGGQWSNYEIAEYCLRQIGPSEVWLTTWAIAEPATRVLQTLKEQGLITALHVILDHRILNTGPKAVQMLKDVADRIRLTDIHAKMLVMMNDTHGMTLMSSANMSRNHRIETGVLTYQRDVSEFHARWITEVIENEKDKTTTDEHEHPND